MNILKRIKQSQVGSALVQVPIITAFIGGVALAGTSFTGVLPEARDTRRAADAYQVTQALAFYYDDNLNFPIYTGVDPEVSWELLQGQLEPTYIYGFPQDPSAESDYRYWSDGQRAKVVWVSEIEGEEKERLVY